MSDIVLVCCSNRGSPDLVEFPEAFEPDIPVNSRARFVAGFVESLLRC
jgi:hypothetical protein